MTLASRPELRLVLTVTMTFDFPLDTVMVANIDQLKETRSQNALQKGKRSMSNQGPHKVQHVPAGNSLKQCELGKI